MSIRDSHAKYVARSEKSRAIRSSRLNSQSPQSDIPDESPSPEPLTKAEVAAAQWRAWCERFNPGVGEFGNSAASVELTRWIHGR